MSVRPASVALLLVSCLTTACAGPADPQTTLAVPSGSNFAVVSLVLEANCGSLDCHGAPARSFRVYGHYGLRLYSGDVVGGADTRDDEVQATYQSIVTVDPETLSLAFRSGGSNVDQWIAISKARGLEHHKGGVRLATGSPGDRCLTSWASGAVDTEACLSDGFGPIPRAGESW